MSLIIRLIGKKEEYKIIDELNALNQSLRDIGISNSPLRPQTISGNTVFPWICLSPSDINYLKNLFLEIKSDSTWTCKSNFTFVGERVFLEDLAKDILKDRLSHLLWHYNFCGYYVPLDFEDLTVTRDFLMYIGSSINLHSELKEISNRIELDLGDYTPDLELLYKQRITELENDSLCFEKMLILYLYNFCLASIRYNLVINFSG